MFKQTLCWATVDEVHGMGQAVRHHQQGMGPWCERHLLGALVKVECNALVRPGGQGVHVCQLAKIQSEQLDPVAVTGHRHQVQVPTVRQPLSTPKTFHDHTIRNDQWMNGTGGAGIRTARHLFVCSVHVITYANHRPRHYCTENV